VVVHAHAQGLGPVLGEGIGRHRQDRCLGVGRQGTDATRRFQAIHHRHLDVHQDQLVGAMLDAALHGRRAIVHHLHDKAQVLQQRHGHFLVERIVFGQQQAVSVLETRHLTR
jgi:hypothetical protein